MRISYWSSYVCSSDLVAEFAGVQRAQARLVGLVEIPRAAAREVAGLARRDSLGRQAAILPALDDRQHGARRPLLLVDVLRLQELLHQADLIVRSEEHTSELQSLMRISYAVFCLKKKRQTIKKNTHYDVHRNNIRNL